MLPAGYSSSTEERSATRQIGDAIKTTKVPYCGTNPREHAVMPHWITVQ